MADVVVGSIEAALGVAMVALVSVRYRRRRRVPSAWALPFSPRTELIAGVAIGVALLVAAAGRLAA